MTEPSMMPGGEPALTGTEEWGSPGRLGGVRAREMRTARPAKRAVAVALGSLALVTASCASRPAASGPVKTGPVGSSPGGASSPPSTLAPLPQRKVTLLEVGDSLGIDLGWGLDWALSNDPHVTVVADAKGDTGLANTGYYNWPVVLRSELASVHPQVVVVFLGANDVQNFYQNGTYCAFGSPAWKAAYGARVAAMMDEVLTAKARLVWVGEPIMQSPSFSSKMALIDSIFRQEAASHPGVVYLPSWPLFATAAGTFNGGTTDITGTPEALRDPDGIHLATGGEDLLAREVVRKLRAVFKLP